MYATIFSNMYYYPVVDNVNYTKNIAVNIDIIITNILIQTQV